MEINKIYQGNSLEIIKTLPDESINTVVTSPPYYGLRDYGVDGQIGLEGDVEGYVQSLVNLFREVKRVLKEDGTIWLNLGDTYWGGGRRGYTLQNTSCNIQKGHKGTRAGETVKNTSGKYQLYKPKDLMGVPWLVAFALQKDGWYLRQDIIWHKPNPMPESVVDRCTKSHEYIFLLSKSKSYYFDYKVIREPAAYDGRKDTKLKGSKKYKDKVIVPDASPQSFTARESERWIEDENGLKVRNKRSVWTVTKRSFKEAHFATYPPELIEPCILAGCPKGGVVLDPFMGAGTTAVVCIQNRRNYVGIEINPEYIQIAEKRLQPVQEKQHQLEYKEEILGKFFDK